METDEVVQSARHGGCAASRHAESWTTNVWSPVFRLSGSRIDDCRHEGAHLRLYWSADFPVRSNSGTFYGFEKFRNSLSFSRCCGLESPRSNHGRDGDEA